VTLADAALSRALGDRPVRRRAKHCPALVPQPLAAVLERRHDPAAMEGDAEWPI